MDSLQCTKKKLHKREKTKKDKNSRNEKKKAKRASRKDEHTRITTTMDQSNTIQCQTADDLKDSTVSPKPCNPDNLANDSDAHEYLREHKISIVDGETRIDGFRPILNFAQLPHHWISKGPLLSFTAPTPIQAIAWPFLLLGRDVIGIAETGSGKTLAFSLPLIEAILKMTEPKLAKAKVSRPHAIVLSPTRELAMQTHQTISSFQDVFYFSTVCLYGGASKDQQRLQLSRNNGADIVVATPGRLKDFLSLGQICLDRAKFVVLDEADRMLDKGFEDDIKFILGCCSPKDQRQTLMFTATWPVSVQGLAAGFLVNPVTISIAGDTETTNHDLGNAEPKANKRITQLVEVMAPQDKERRLVQLLRDSQRRDGGVDRILVFCLYKKEASRIENFIRKNGVRVVSIHGDLQQEKRTQSLEAFKAGTPSVLVATDVAARGLDIPDVKLVINVTFPLTIEDYVHRIGRTGRAGKDGKAVTFFTEQDKSHSGSLINVLKASDQSVPDALFKFGTTVKKKTHEAYGAFFKNVDMGKMGSKITFD